ncbi:hypothetical protein [Kribbella deserti]|uniref:Secreted protein n=1 Tax=Kribbella deserti TaxID=1926257 RepID=A0ABV6QLZ1_9ACTN
MKNFRTTLTTMIAMASGAVALTAAAPASAVVPTEPARTSGTSAPAAGCYAAGTRSIPIDGTGWVTRNVYSCHVYRSTQLWHIFGDGGYADENSILNAGRNWFVCQMKSGLLNNPPVGSAVNNHWVYTLGDRGGWGWFPATHISSGGNWSPIPGVPSCPPAFYHQGPGGPA